VNALMAMHRRSGIVSSPACFNDPRFSSAPFHAAPRPGYVVARGKG
jgi:hypothetical protein